MERLGKISSTLFVPLAGRILVSEKLPDLLYDKKALEMKELLQDEEVFQNQSQYTMVASASRSYNMDRYIEEFISYNSEPVVVELGCGLETSYYRCQHKPYQWFGVDLPEVIKFRHKHFGMEKITFISKNLFDYEWMDIIRSVTKYRPVLFIASGLFQYFTYEQVLKLLKEIKDKFKNPYIAFDCLNSAGFKRVGKYMKQVGHEDATMHFYLDKATDLVKDIGEDSFLIEEKDMYKIIQTKGCSLKTKITMKVSDLYHMVKVVYIKL